MTSLLQKIRSFLTWPVIVTALLLLALAAYFWRGSDDISARFRTEAIDRGDISQRVSANGTLNPVTLVSVGTQVSGTITALYADFNDRVQQGQVLMQLDDALLRASLQQSEASLASAQSALRLAQSDIDRIAPLAKDGFVSQQELDKTQQAFRDAQARLVQARSQVARDRANLGYSVIRSPVSGVVVLRAVDAGQTVAASFNTPELFKIAKDLREMQIDAYFAEADIGQIRVGQKVSFRVDAFSGQRFQGAVKQIRLNPKTEQNVVTYNVVVAVENPEEKLLPGMTAYVDIGVQERRDVLRVPNAALRFKPSDESLVLPAPEEKPAAARTSALGGFFLSAAVAADGDAVRGERGPRRELSEEERAAWRARREQAAAQGEPSAVASAPAATGSASVMAPAGAAPASGSADRGVEGAAQESEGRGGRRGSARDGGGGMQGGMQGGAGGVGRVHVLRDGKLQVVKVRIGITDRRYTELTGDEFKAGDLVVVEELVGKDAQANAQSRGMRFGM
ncbi:MAG: efflux RND transporter periplasmic adaptor subunit [Moraxellaceae bacterium]|nr:efflux RND transporter periplasmic adaptor subunit [Moraxellaceae bacterium]